MTHAIEFIETRMFTRQIKAFATDDELKNLQRDTLLLAARFEFHVGVDYRRV
jgi:hypothetical protein